MHIEELKPHISEHRRGGKLHCSLPLHYLQEATKADSGSNSSSNNENQSLAADRRENLLLLRSTEVEQESPQGGSRVRSKEGAALEHQTWSTKHEL